MDKVITISRQYGSGGREIGAKLAEKFSIPFYDNELITRAASIVMDEAAANVDPENEDRIVQKGKHEELIGQKGIYHDFVLGRKEAIGWKREA